MKAITALLAAMLCTSILTTVSVPSACAAPPYAAIDRHALSVRYPGSIPKLAAALTRPAKNDREKARAIYRWIAANVSYDVEGYLSGRHGDTSPEGTLRRRQSVCAGYASLFEALGKAAGLEVAYISGHGKGIAYLPGDTKLKANHDWNAVKIDGRWQLIDVTWGAGALIGKEWQRRFNEHYFLTPPEEFIFDHFPEEAKWQLLDPPISRQEYSQLAFLRDAFFLCGLKVDSHSQLRIRVKDSACLTFTGPAGVQLTAVLVAASNRRQLSGSWTLCQQAEGKYQVHVRWPRAGNYELVIFAKNNRDSGSLWEAAHYLIEGTSGATEFPYTFGSFVELGATLYQPLGKVLSAGRSQAFSLTVPGAREVAVVQSREWRRLTKQGNTFTGKLTLARGQVQVVADSHVLLVYEAK